MREISGVVIIQRKEDGQRVILGRGSSESERVSPLEENGLRPFSDIPAALSVHSLMTQGGSRSFDMAKIKFRLAEGDDDLRRLAQGRGAKYIVVTGSGSGPHNLLGRYREGARRMFDGCASLNWGAEPIADLEEAKRLAGEAARQSQCPARVAEFSIRECG